MAAWDRLLVENSDKISKLYSKTFQAERDAAEVEKQLRNVESQQEELSQWLDVYENQVDQLIKSSVGQSGEGTLQGPDQDRERTYKLAERLNERVNEMNHELKETIEEINGVSATLSKTKTDDPVSFFALCGLSGWLTSILQLSQVVKVLNQHLQQLTQIDAGAAQLKAKIEVAQRDGQRIGSNGFHGVGSDSTEDFYRSYMRR